MKYCYILLIFCFCCLESVEKIDFKAQIAKEHTVVIEKILDIMANSGKLGLLLKSGDLKKMGHRLEGKISALEFLGYVFSTKNTLSKMQKMRYHNFSVYKLFVKSLGKGIRSLSNSGQMNQHLDGFSKYLKLNKEIIESKINKYISSNNSNDLVDFVNYLFVGT